MNEIIESIMEYYVSLGDNESEARQKAETSREMPMYGDKYQSTYLLNGGSKLYIGGKSL